MHLLWAIIDSQPVRGCESDHIVADERLRSVYRAADTDGAAAGGSTPPRHRRTLCSNASFKP